MTLECKLHKLEEELDRQGAPVVGRLLPGRALSSTRAALHDAFGFAPEEIVTWFAWHDGVRGGGDQSSEVFDDNLGLYRPTSLEDALVKQLYPAFLERIGGPALTLFSNDSDIYLAARLDAHPVTTPMFKVCFKDSQDQTFQRTASLEGLIDAWLEMFDLGLTWKGRWPADWQLPPPSLLSDDLACRAAI